MAEIKLIPPDEADKRAADAHRAAARRHYHRRMQDPAYAERKRKRQLAKYHQRKKERTNDGQNDSGEGSGTS